MWSETRFPCLLRSTELKEQRLMANPNVVCNWDTPNLTVWGLAWAGILLWSVGTIALIFMLVRFTKDRHHQAALRKYGYFYIGLEPNFWWWDIVRG